MPNRRAFHVVLIPLFLASCETEPTGNPASYSAGLSGGSRTYSGGAGPSVDSEVPGTVQTAPFEVVLLNRSTKDYIRGPIEVSSFYILGPQSQADVPFMRLSEDPEHNRYVVGTQLPGARWTIRWTSNANPSGGQRYIDFLSGPGTVTITWEDEGFQGNRGVPFVACSGGAACRD